MLPLNFKFKCEFEYTEYSRGSKYMFVIYQTSQIEILVNWIVSNMTEYKQIFAKGWKAEIELFVTSHNLS